MFRMSHYLRQLVTPTPVRRRTAPVRPVVIWNLTQRCNLKCRHCYAVAADRHFPGELSYGEACGVVDDLAAYRIPALILSGGEPLARADTLDLARRAKAHGIYTALSSNGTTIKVNNIPEIADIGFDYVGISLDGLGATNDWFRGAAGAFDQALSGVRACIARDIKVGLRFTMTNANADQLPDLLNLARNEGVEKFYLSHLVYAGRGNKHRTDDTTWAVTRAALDHLIDVGWTAVRNGEPFEIVTGNNDADAVYLLQWAATRFPAEQVAHLRSHLEAWGGNASGSGVANIDSQGNVHPDTYWSGYTIDTVKKRPFSMIWEDESDPMLRALRLRPRPLEGRCGACRHKAVCGGNTRIRALQLTGNPFAADPACYLSDAEIGIAASENETRAPLTPFGGRRHDPAHRYA